MGEDKLLQFKERPQELKYPQVTPGATVVIKRQDVEAAFRSNSTNILKKRCWISTSAMEFSRCTSTSGHHSVDWWWCLVVRDVFVFCFLLYFRPPQDNYLNTLAAYCCWPCPSLYGKAKFNLIRKSPACFVFPPFAWSEAEQTLWVRIRCRDVVSHSPSARLSGGEVCRRKKISTKWEGIVQVNLAVYNFIIRKV